MTHALIAIACLGHLVVVIGCHNWIYGLRLPQGAGKVIHLLLAVVVLLLPVTVLATFGWDLAALPSAPVLAWPAILEYYLAACVIVAVVWLPLLTLARSLRREPARLLRTEVVDVAAVLGRPPVGNGHGKLLTRLPGNEVFQAEFLEKELILPRLPAAWDGLTVLHLSDLHLHGTPDRDYYRVVLDRCAAWEPDLLTITGDIADSNIHHRWILPLLGRLRWRIAGLAILGNHDHRYDVAVIRRRLRRLGLRVPENSWLELEVRGEKLVVIGHEGPWLRGKPDLSDCPRELFRLCLSHTPDNIRWARQHGIDLMLAGHVHGGQIRLPVFGSVLVPSRLGRRHDAGAYTVPPTLLHVSRGLGGEHPVRYGCRPEVTLLRLRCPESSRISS